MVLNYLQGLQQDLLVAEEKDIDKVFQNCSKVVAVHSEDEEILNKNKKLIKGGCAFTSIWRSEECAMSFTRRIVRLMKSIIRKHMFYILLLNKK